MFRRRPLRPFRPLVRPVIRPVVVPPVGRGGAPGSANVPPALLRANELMAAGQYAEAAEIYEQFGHGAEVRSGPRAGHFYLLAGRCRVLAGQVPAGVTLLKHGLSAISAQGAWQRLQTAGRRTVEELKERGLTAEAADIEAWLSGAIPAGVAAPVPVQAPAKSRLPTLCPGCGGPLRADEVEWTDEETAECQFCGSPVRAE